MHLELASIADLDFIREIGTNVLHVVDSLGLNEQELGYLVLALKHDKITPQLEKETEQRYTDPTVDTVVDSIQYLFEKIPTLSRVHFHCLKYHIVAEISDSPWGNNTLSVASGAYIASAQSCQVSKEKKDKIAEYFTIEFNEDTWGDFDLDIEKSIDFKKPVFSFDIEVAFNPTHSY